MVDAPGVAAGDAVAVCPARALRADGDRWSGGGVCVVRHRGEVYAFEEECPHGAVSLSGAKVVRGAVVCPGHGARFRLGDGKVLSGPAPRPLVCFDVVRTASGTEVRARTDGDVGGGGSPRWLVRLVRRALPRRRRAAVVAPLWCRPSGAVPARRRESRV